MHNYFISFTFYPGCSMHRGFSNCIMVSSIDSKFANAQQLDSMIEKFTEDISKQTINNETIREVTIINITKMN